MNINRSESILGALLYSKEAEDSVIGCMISQPQEVMAKVDGVLKESDFFVSANRIIFQILIKMDRIGIPLDVLTIHQALVDAKMDKETSSPQILGELLNSFSSHLNVSSYISIIIEKSKYRTLHSLSDKIKAALSTSEPIQEILDHAQAILDEVGTVTDGSISSGKEAWSDLYLQIHSDPLERQKEWLKTGFMQLDSILNALRPGRVYVLAARPGIGKTALALNMIRNLCLSKISCGLITMEMGDLEVRERLLANHASVDTRRIENGMNEAQKYQVSQIWSEIQEWPLHVLDQSTLTVSDLRMRIRQLVHLGCRAIFIDYLQLMSSEDPRKKRHDTITEVCRAVKGFARRYKIPIIELVQINRSGGDDELDLEHLAESDAIGRDADFVLIMYREGESMDHRHIPITWKIAKNRQGPRAKIATNYDGPFVRFSEKGVI